MKTPEITYSRLPDSERQPLFEYYVSLFTDIADDFTEGAMSDSDVYAIEAWGMRVGSFGLLGGDRLTMFGLCPSFLRHAHEIFGDILEKFDVKFAFVMTCDELFLSMCMDYQTAVHEQSYVFHRGEDEVRPPEFGRESLTLAVAEDKSDILDNDMVAENIAAGKYYVMRQNGVFLGHGFYNPSDFTPNRVSIGMTVHPDHRLRGVGRSIIMHLAGIAAERGLEPVCGCWYKNHASRATLESAGFVTETRYLNVDFKMPL